MNKLETMMESKATEVEEEERWGRGVQREEGRAHIDDDDDKCVRAVAGPQGVCVLLALTR